MQINLDYHIKRVRKQLERYGGAMPHTPLLMRNQSWLNAKLLREVINAMLDRGLITETWTEEEHIYELILPEDEE